MEDERKVGAMGTKYRKTHNGKPVEMDDDGRVILCSGTTIHPDWLEMGGYIEPVPTVMVELDRAVAENYLKYYHLAPTTLAIRRAIEAALND